MIKPEPQPIDERRIIERFLAGAPEAVEILDSWIDAALRDGGDSPGAEREDLKQEVRIRVFRNLARGDFVGRSSLRTYIHRIARNVSIDFLRETRRRRERDRLEESGSSEGAGAATAAFSAWIARDTLARILEDLSDEERVMLRMIFAENCSYAEVARHLGLPEGTVKSRVSRCKDRILRRQRALFHGGRSAR